MRAGWWWVALVGSLVWGGCASEGTLVIQVRTDVPPERGFATVRAELGLASGDPTRVIDVAAGESTEWGRGVRIAEVDGLAAGEYRVRIGLRDGAGGTIVERPVRVAIDGDLHVVTVLLTRTCVGVMCPVAGDDASAIACLAGACVPEECVEESSESCGLAMCTNDAECPASPVACALAECTTSGACFTAPDHTGCAASEVCDPTLGCVAVGSCPDLDSDTICDDIDPDADGDGFANDTDCDDLDADVYPGAPESCDGIVNDCASPGAGTRTADPDAIFVSKDTRPAWIDADNFFGSVLPAVAQALSTGQDIYIATGLYTEETLVIDGGMPINIHGTRDPCDFAPASGSTRFVAPRVGIDIRRDSTVTIEDMQFNAMPGGSPPQALGLRVTSAMVTVRRSRFETDPATGVGATTSGLELSGGTVQLEEVESLPGTSTSNGFALLAAGTALTVTGGTYRVGSTARAITVLLGADFAGGNYIFDGAWIEGSSTDQTIGVSMEGGTLELVDCVVKASGDAEAIAFQVTASTRTEITHSYLGASATAGSATASWWSGATAGRLVNTIVYAESTAAGATGIDLSTAGGVSVLGTETSVLGPSAVYVDSGAGPLTLAELETQCGMVTGCTEARGNWSLGCRLDEMARLQSPACVDRGVEPPPGTSPGLLDFDFQGDPRPNGGTWDIGPDET